MHGIDKKYLGSRMDCYDSNRFTERTLEKSWTCFEAEPDLVLFPVSMALDKNLTKQLSPSGGDAYKVWAPFGIMLEIAVLSDFPTLDDVNVRYAVCDNENLAKKYVKALSGVMWINSSGANMFSVTSPLLTRP